MALKKSKSIKFIKLTVKTNVKGLATCADPFYKDEKEILLSHSLVLKRLPNNSPAVSIEGHTFPVLAEYEVKGL